MSIQDKWDEAERTGLPVDIGGMVVCDYCLDDYTDRKDQGGMIFVSKATCPDCTNKMMPGIVKYSERHFIRAECPDDKSFADFVREYRGGNNTIRVRKL